MSLKVGELEPLEAFAGGTEAAVVADLAKSATEAKPLAHGEVFTVPTGDGGLKVIDTDEYHPYPRRAKAARVATDGDSFVAYVNRHKTANTEVFAHTLSSSVVAIIDSHGGFDGPAGWQGHKLTLALEHSKEWLAWTARDLGAHPRDGWFGQSEFAEFIEARALDVHDPDHATLIELALTFEAKSKVDFTSTKREEDGSVNFSYAEEVTAKAGQKGNIIVPKQLKLALRPYIGGPRVYIYAHFRYRLNGGDLKLGFALERPENILETAFSDILTEIREGRSVTKDGETTVIHEGIGDVPIFHGKP